LVWAIASRAVGASEIPILFVTQTLVWAVALRAFGASEIPILFVTQTVGLGYCITRRWRFARILAKP
jgi:hypothetical protein